LTGEKAAGRLFSRGPFLCGASYLQISQALRCAPTTALSTAKASTSFRLLTTWRAQDKA
jgi:hypothetical protein